MHACLAPCLGHAIIFSHSEGCLFTLLIVSFDVQKILSLCPHGAHSVGLDQDPAPPASVLRGLSRGGWREEVIRAALCPPDRVPGLEPSPPCEGAAAFTAALIPPGLREVTLPPQSHAAALDSRCLAGRPLTRACWTPDTVPGAPTRPPTRPSSEGDPP